MNRKVLKVLFVIVLLAIIFILGKDSFTNRYFTIQQEDGNLPDTSDSIDPSLWVAVDGLGRELSTNKTKSSSHQRDVGIFFWTWHLYNDRDNVVNVNNINKANPTRKNDYAWWNNYVSKKPGSNIYWWNESIYNYYMSEEYVLRKQAELLADAGIDFVVFDCTNGDVNYTEPYELLLKVWKKAKEDGVKVPKIAFMLPFAYSYDTYDSFMYLYNRTYNPSSSNYQKYSDLYYKLDGKPLVLLNSSGAPNDMISVLNNFTVRAVNTGSKLVATGAQSKWGWLCSYPQAYYRKSNGKTEQITVSVAQNINYTATDPYKSVTCMNGSTVMGRSYAKNNYTYTYTYKNQNIVVGNTITGPTAKSTNTSFYGRNFQQQWDYAIQIDPEIVFITGWNEWNMGRFESLAGVSNCFPDQFNDEYSRDIEPSKGELKDYYYYQLVDNVRKYKGVSSQPSQNTSVTITKTSDWNNSNIINYNHYTGGYQRDSVGMAKTRYTNKTFRNDIKKAKVSYDASYIYFYVETVSNLTSYSSDKWMRLLIDTKKNNNDNWEEFEYIVNRVSGSSTKLVLEKSNGGWNFTKVGDVDYKVTGKILEIKIKREYIGQTSDKINFNFKWCDNNLGNGDIMTIYTDGDAAPGGRFAFHFEGTKPFQQTVAEDHIVGDVDGNGTVGLNDYLLIKKHLLSISKLTGEKLNYADVDGNGTIGIGDYLAVKKIILYGSPSGSQTTPVVQPPTQEPVSPPVETPVLTGWQKINDKWYYYNETGVAVTGWQQLNWSRGTDWFYFATDGVMQTGWQKLSWSGGISWFYFDLTDGNMFYNITKNINGTSYHFDSNGVCTTMPACST